MIIDFPRLSRVASGELFIKNKLSKKPAQAMEKLEKVIKSQNKYNMSVTQDYSKNAVELNLLGKSYGHEGDTQGYQVFQTKYVPATSAAKAYEKTAKEMIETEDIANSYALSEPDYKPSFLEKVLNFIDNMLNRINQ